MRLSNYPLSHAETSRDYFQELVLSLRSIEFIIWTDLASDNYNTATQHVCFGETMGLMQLCLVFPVNL